MIINILNNIKFWERESTVLCGFTESGGGCEHHKQAVREVHSGEAVLKVNFEKEFWKE